MFGEIMKKLAIYLLFSLFLVIGCGDEEIPIATPSDTTPPTIIGTNVLAGKIPVNTPIIVVFNERVDLTSAQRGILVRSSIDAEQVEGVVSLHNQGREAKFTPTTKMTSGAYVLIVIAVNDSAGNTLMMPVSIFFGAVEVDTTKPPADITPPKVLKTIPAEEQSVETTGSITIRFDEVVDEVSAKTGIFVSGVEGIVEIEGAVAIFKPLEPMKTGKHNLTIVGVKDLSGNVLESSHIITFEVVAKEKLPPTGDPTAQPSTAGGRPLFFADFEPGSRKAIPSKAVNDPQNWKPENPETQWTLADFANGTKGLRQTAEGCGTSGNTLLPGMTRHFTDGIIQLEMSFGDDDSAGIVFRKSADDKGYLVVFGVNETPAVIVALLDKGCAEVGNCLDQVACENNAANTLIQAPHGLGEMDQTNSTIYFGRIEAIGNTIKVWYLKRDDVKDPNAPNLGKPVVEIKDNTHKSGTVGFWHESMQNGTIDNVLVTGPGGLRSVNTQGKQASTWGELKE